MKITEDYVSFEVAKLLKEKGFDGQCVMFKNIVKKTFGTTWNTESKCRIPIPTHQMACKWLREVHKIDIEIFVTYKNEIPHYQWRIECLNNQDTIVETLCCITYEKAVEAAIKYTLENLI